jgi:TPR repeat protein
LVSKAAEGGFVNSICNLAICYYNRGGMRKDLGKAFHWFQKTAEGGVVDSMHGLALCYKNGEGIRALISTVWLSFYQTVTKPKHDPGIHY